SLHQFVSIRALCCVCQVKKASRWSCKLCGEKQSLLKEFGQGSAADCRRHVQKLNAMRGAMMEEQEHKTWSLR
uniref:MRN complex-interacting protein N-terminal domain-containing protein n=1 Tax=Mola mola TaxID=94237 RepID=A0A3Q4AMC8_MOLML